MLSRVNAFDIQIYHFETMVLLIYNAKGQVR